MFYSVHVAMHAIICHIFATFWHLSAITCKIWQTTYSGEIIPKQNQLIRWCFFFFFQCSLYTYHINTNLGCLLLEAYFRFNPMPVYTEIKCSAIISRTCGFPRLNSPRSHNQMTDSTHNACCKVRRKAKSRKMKTRIFFFLNTYFFYHIFWMRISRILIWTEF